MAEQVFPALPIIAGGGRVVAAPFQFLLSDDDRLRIVSINSQTGVTLALQGYRLDARGAKHDLARAHTPNTDRTFASEDFVVGSGALLNLTVFASAGSPRIGQTYVLVQLVRGAGTAVIVLGTLLAGYVTARQALGWPGSPIESSIAGGSVIRTVTGTDPAAGVEISETVPTGARWQVLALGMELVTDATVDNRRPTLVLDDGTSNYARSAQPNTQAASVTRTWTWQNGMPLETSLSTDAEVAGLPAEIVLLADHRIRTSTANLKAGDNWNAPTIVVREWLEAA